MPEAGAPGGAPTPNGTPPSSTPPAAAPSASPTPSDWMLGFNDDMKGYVSNKGFKGPQDVVESYRNFEKLMGAPRDRLLTLPENMDSPEGRAIWEKLGAPKDAKEYGFVPKEGESPEVYAQFAETFKELGVPRLMGEKIVEFLRGQGEAMNKAQTDQIELQKTNATANLKKEWGAAFEQNKVLADQGAIRLGMSQDEVTALGSALGPDKAMLLLHRLAVSTGEHTFVTGGPANGGVNTPNQAQSRIKELITDKGFQTRLMSGDVSTKKEWQRLHEEAYPGNMPL